MNGCRNAAAALLLSTAIRLGLDALPPLTGGVTAAHAYGEMILRQLLIWGVPSLLMAEVWLRRDRWRWAGMDLPVALVIGGAAQYALSGITADLRTMLGESPGLIDLPADALTWLLAVLALVIVPAVTEELFFRGGLLPALSGSPWGGLMATAIFALMHASGAGLPAYMVIGGVLTLLALGTGRLMPGILLHGAYNGFALAWAVWPVKRLWAVMIIALAVVAALMAWLIQHRKSAQTHQQPVWPVLLAAGVAIILRLL